VVPEAWVIMRNRDYLGKEENTYLIYQWNQCVMATTRHMKSRDAKNQVNQSICLISDHDMIRDTMHATCRDPRSSKLID
jgi:hypothetical protein